MTNKRTVLEDVQQFNLSYLLLIQRIASETDSDVTTISGLSEEMIAAIQSLDLPKLASLAETNQFLVKPAAGIIKDISLPSGSTQLDKGSVFNKFL
ncbi:flagellar transcriptional regulator FlhD [Yokenella regensburgei]|uniref:flagellar transcriptional regulator FlhD n=1 Tax=Yokenella regensburgei TaxID=158877 RepID=UPI003F168A54